LQIRFRTVSLIYEKVLLYYPTPLTFKEYLALSDEKQSPINNIVKERTVAQLIVKNSSNDRLLREHLVQTYSINNSTCYPNTISEAVSLLSTFKKAEHASNNSTNDNNNSSEDDVVVSYHESEEYVICDNDDIQPYHDDTTVKILA
jgi:hypothetical protein